MHQLQGIGGYLRQALRFVRQAGQDAGATLRRLVEQDTLAVILFRDGLRNQFGFFDLKGHLDAALEGCLQGRHGFAGMSADRGGMQYQQVAVILDKRDDPLVGYPLQQGVVTFGAFLSRFVRILFAPGPSDGVDVKAQLIRVLASAPATVDAPDACRRGVSETRQYLIALTNLGQLFLNPVIRAGHEPIGGLQFESLALPVFIID